VGKCGGVVLARWSGRWERALVLGGSPRKKGLLKVNEKPLEMKVQGCAVQGGEWKELRMNPSNKAIGSYVAWIEEEFHVHFIEFETWGAKYFVFRAQLKF
jgi:hypothetical protein